MNYSELKFHKLDNNLSEHLDYIISLSVEILKQIRTTINFDTRFYKDEDCNNSVKGLLNYCGGNCVSMAKLAVLLFRSCNINASLIPSTIPKRLRRPGQEPICHVLCCVKVENIAYVILDPAFYFMEPIVVLKNDSIKPVSLYNKNYKVNSKLYNSKNYIYKFSNTQKIPAHTDYIRCQADNGDVWRCFLIGVENPDETITSNHKDVFIDDPIFIKKRIS